MSFGLCRFNIEMLLTPSNPKPDRISVVIWSLQQICSEQQNVRHIFPRIVCHKFTSHYKFAKTFFHKTNLHVKIGACHKCVANWQKVCHHCLPAAIFFPVRVFSFPKWILHLKIDLSYIQYAFTAQLLCGFIEKPTYIISVSQKQTLTKQRGHVVFTFQKIATQRWQQCV